MANLKFSVEKTAISGVQIITYDKFEENRGNIWTTFVDDVTPIKFHHDKFSISNFNVLRGIHGDNKSTKLVTAVYGEILQVVVDCRQSSKTYREYISVLINRSNPCSVLIPPGCGNAYYVQSEQAVYHYKLSYPGDYIDAQDQFTFRFDDPIFGIKWPTLNPILSTRDNIQ